MNQVEGFHIVPVGPDGYPAPDLASPPVKVHIGDIYLTPSSERTGDTSCTVASDPSVLLDEATYRDLDILVDSYIDFCDVARAKRVRSARLRYAIDLHQRAEP